MSLKQIQSWHKPLEEKDSQLIGGLHSVHRSSGHRHCWKRALSRRQFIQAAAGTAGVLLSSGLWMPALAQVAGPSGADPKPIPGGTQYLGLEEVFHIFDSVPGVEPSTITDFNGAISRMRVQGTGTGTDTTTSATTNLLFEANMGFMRGIYRGTDGRLRQGTFGFI